MNKFMLKIWSMIAIHWLRKDYRAEKKELINLGSFILKAERKNVPDTTTGGTKIERTFSIHRHVPPNTVGPRAMWIYDKYLVDHDCKYAPLRSGKYPEGWE